MSGRACSLRSRNHRRTSSFALQSTVSSGTAYCIDLQVGGLRGTLYKPCAVTITLLVILSRTNWEDQVRRAKRVFNFNVIEIEDEETPQTSFDYYQKIDGSSNV
ncbi:hypothetical protein HAX54_006532 [Datura stramonium]|uniref:Uncharacterized protein n=1 Tax=Datura stramonium TaxID=4076 RepID=A0ABS8RUG9_DATST|nr:hypothetical protein [Datura stramonium]